jgi:hypothetical protein
MDEARIMTMVKVVVFFVKMCPYREGEDVPKRPRYSVPELVADHYAHQRDLGAPWWAL